MSPVLGRLIAKDLYLYRWLIAGGLAAGALTLALTRFGGGDGVRSGPNLGFILFITAMTTFGILVPMLGILRERQEGSRLFVLSLPLTPAQYVLAKLVAALVAFLAPWTTLTAGVVGLAFLAAGPTAEVQLFLLIMLALLASFCVLTAVVVITFSEPWSIAAILVTNVSVTLFLTQVGRLAGTPASGGHAVATWSTPALAVLAAELAVILLSLVLALYLAPGRTTLLEETSR